MKREQFWAVENVKTFRGHDVVNGEVDVSDDAYGDYIDEIYPTVEVAGIHFNPSRIIQELDPVAWRCGMGNWESELLSELEDAISCEDSDDIEFIDGDEFELFDKEEFQEFVMSHGYGKPTDEGFEIGEKLHENGSSIAEAAAEVVTMGLTITEDE